MFSGASKTPRPLGADATTHDAAIVRQAPRPIYTLVVLTVAYAFAYIDRSIVSVLLPAIKREFHVGDAALAFLSGFAFAIFFIILGVPIAALADRRPRRGIIALSVAAWSVMTACCGLAGGFLQLVLARIGVGVGEAGLTPPAHAMISDIFPRRTRGLALAVYQSGVYVGVLFGLALGGYLSQKLGWRAAFYAVGLPGLIVAVAIQLTVVEPTRGAHDGPADSKQPHAGIAAVFGHIWRTAPVRYGYVGMALCAMVSQTQSVWLPSFLTRSHHLPIAKVGLMLGLAGGIGGVAGTVIGGRLSDVLGARDERWRLWIVGIAMLLAPACLLTVLFTTSLTVLFVMATASVMVGSVHLGPTLATFQNLTPLNMRARVVSLVIFILNLLGLGVGPLVVGVLSDRLQPTLGADSLRYALTPVVVFAVLAACAYFFAGRALGAHAEGGDTAADAPPIRGAPQ